MFPNKLALDKMRQYAQMRVNWSYIKAAIRADLMALSLEKSLEIQQAVTTRVHAASAGGKA